MRLWKRILVLTAGIIVGGCALLLYLNVDTYSWGFMLASPEEALRHFCAYGQDYWPGPAEDMLIDPLILAGRGVVPLVIAEVRKRDMPKRGYAIHFLGNGRYRAALPVLECIVRDETEHELSRSDALRAIYHIDRSLGRRYADRYQARDAPLGVAARAIGAGRLRVRRRTYLEAVLGHHD